MRLLTDERFCVCKYSGRGETLTKVWECNGEKVLNLKHLVTLIEEGEKVIVPCERAPATIASNDCAIIT